MTTILSLKCFNFLLCACFKHRGLLNCFLCTALFGSLSRDLGQYLKQVPHSEPNPKLTMKFKLLHKLLVKAVCLHVSSPCRVVFLSLIPLFTIILDLQAVIFGFLLQGPRGYGGNVWLEIKNTKQKLKQS